MRLASPELTPEKTRVAEAAPVDAEPIPIIPFNFQLGTAGVATKRRVPEGPKKDTEKRQDVDKAITPPLRVGQIHQPKVQGPREYPGRISTRVTPELQLAIERYSEADRVSVSELVNNALEDYLITKQEQRGVTPTNDRVFLDHPAEIIVFSRLIITAIEDTLEYSVERHHNRPPPALLIEDSNEDYLHELRRLVAELKRLNESLEFAAASPAPKRKRAATTPAVKKSAVDVKKHLNTFLDKYAQSLGKGAAALTIGSFAALLIRFGVPPDAFTAIMKNLKP